MRRRYEEALAHRNRLLSTAAAGPPDERLIAPFTEQLVDHGAAILDYRLRCLERLMPLATDAYARLAGGGEELTARYLLGEGASEQGCLGPASQAAGEGPGAREAYAALLKPLFATPWPRSAPGALHWSGHTATTW